jgi:hypothetical protein
VGQGRTLSCIACVRLEACTAFEVESVLRAGSGQSRLVNEGGFMEHPFRPAIHVFLSCVSFLRCLSQ